MRAVRFHGREDIRVDEVEEPVCGDGQIKVYLDFLLSTLARLLQCLSNNKT